MDDRTKTRDASELEAGYEGWHRSYEIGGIVATTVGFVWLCVQIARSAPLSGWWMPLAMLVGILFADFVSGFVHWMFDTWGSVDTPIVGRVAIRTFRHHHVDQKAITRHDFIETNGHNFALAFIAISAGLLVVRPATATLFDVFIGMSLVAGSFFVSFTSQIHKWAHMDEPPRWIRVLQRARIIISPTHHSVHHSAPYNRNYCITVGWLNGPLRAIRFFEVAEWLITLVTGHVPREDDLGEELAVQVVAESEDERASKDEALRSPGR